MSEQAPAASLPAPPAEADLFKCLCGELWAHPALRLLLGDALRPGGRDLTGRLLDHLDLPVGARALDIGSGTGVTLELLRHRGCAAVGLDRSASLAADASERSAATVGDAETLPFAPGAFDAVLAECVLSAVPDKEAALGEIRDVLRPGGWLAMSDVTLAAHLPEPLDTLLSWVACAAGALDVPVYQELLGRSGFEVLVLEDHAAALGSLVAKARRRAALLQAATRVGVVPGPDELVGPEVAALVRELADGEEDLGLVAQQVLGQVAEAVAAGDLGYAALVARRS